MSEYYFRQLDLFDPRKKNPSITIIGAGSIGSTVALALAKMGMKHIELVDFDVVTRHNIANQIVKRTHLEKFKVDCVKEVCEEFSPEEVDITVQKNRFEDPETSSEIVITATDNIEARIQVVKIAQESPLTRFFIDARMAGELLHIFGFNPHSDKTKEYLEFFSAKPAENLPCTARTIVYNVFMCASYVANLVKKYCSNEPVPFHIIYDMNQMVQIVSWDGIDKDD